PGGFFLDAEAGIRGLDVAGVPACAGPSFGDAAVGAAAGGREEARAGRDRVTQDDPEGVGRATVVDAQRVGQVVAGQDRVGAVALGDVDVGLGLHVGGLGSAVVGQVVVRSGGRGAGG